MSRGKFSSKNRINLEARPRSYSTNYTVKNQARRTERLIIKTSICIVLLAGVFFANRIDSGLSKAFTDNVNKAVSYQVQWNELFKSDLISSFESRVASLLRREDVPVYQEPSYTLIEPVNGHLTSEFEEKDHPVFNTKIEPRGLEYSLFESQPVLAADGGVVLSVLDSTYQGKRVVLQHGDGYKTVYDGVETCDVEQEQLVDRGQSLGSIEANEEISKLFFFEVWKDNEAVNPVDFFDTEE